MYKVYRLYVRAMVEISANFFGHRSFVTESEIVKEVYAALNRNDVPAALKYFDPEIERIEPEGFPMSGTYHGIEKFKELFIEARETWAEGSCEPERIITSGDKIVALVNVRVRLKNKTDWVEGRIADGFIFRNGKIILFKTFVKRDEALKWADIKL
jgi:ketosteroid isomerase-like protein